MQDIVIYDLTIYDLRFKNVVCCNLAIYYLQFSNLIFTIFLFAVQRYEEASKKPNFFALFPAEVLSENEKSVSLHT